jgi:hypothetical protein
MLYTDVKIYLITSLFKVSSALALLNKVVLFEVFEAYIKSKEIL